MKIMIQIIILVLQLLAANLLGFVPAVAMKIGNGWELLVFIFGFSLGVWGVGALSARMRKSYQARSQGIRLMATLLFCALGVVVILLTPAIGFVRILYPLAGAFIGYYLPGVFQKR